MSDSSIPLSSVPPTWLPGTEPYEAYQKCLKYELTSVNYPKDTKNTLQFTHVFAARLLGYLLLHVHMENGRKDLSREIISCVNEEALHELGEHYNHYLILVFQRTDCVTPQPTPPASPSELSSLRGYAHSKQQILMRDNYCNAFSDAIYGVSFDKDSGKNGLLPAGVTGFAVPISATHIIPTINLDGESGKVTADIIQRFGGISIANELSGENSHRLENLLSLATPFDSWFGELMLWLEKTEIPNQYQAKSVTPSIDARLASPVVTFANESPHSQLPLPSSKYLEFHAACAKVAHLSGMERLNSDVVSEMQQTPVLASEGGSADLLSAAIARSPTKRCITLDYAEEMGDSDN